MTSIDNITKFWLPSIHYLYGDKASEYDLYDTRTLAIQDRVMITINDINPSCFMISKLQDVSPKGVLKLTLKQDDFNPKRDNVDLKICDYYTDSGDPVIPAPVVDPHPHYVSTIHYMYINDDGELAYDMAYPVFKIGTQHYFGVDFSDEGVEAKWHIDLVNDNNELSDSERVAIEKLITIREVGPTSISLKFGKSNKLKGKSFNLTVSDIDGKYKSFITLEVAE